MTLTLQSSDYPTYLAGVAYNFQVSITLNECSAILLILNDMLSTLTIEYILDPSAHQEILDDNKVISSPAISSPNYVYELTDQTNSALDAIISYNSASK